MAQETHDLPDPLDKPDATSTGSADDLVAQMADQAIDLMMKESQTKSTDPVVEEVERATNNVQESLNNLMNDLDDKQSADTKAAEKKALLNQPMEVVGNATEPEPGGVDDLHFDLPEDKSETPIVDNLHPKIDQESVDEIIPPTEIHDPKTDLDDPDASHDEIPTIEPAAPIASAEMKALLADMMPAIPEREPILVKILRILNAPFSAVPDHVRDLLGHVAILTLINALAVLGYVLFLRLR